MKIVTFTTIGSLKLCENFLLSTRNVGVEENVVVYCMDKVSYDKIQSDYNCEVRSFETDVTEEFHEYGKPQFRRVTESKIQIILNALQQEDSIIYTDCDVVFMENPIDLVLAAEEMVSNDFDMDIYFASDDPFMYICTGFMYIKNTENVHNLFKKYFELSQLHGVTQSEVMYDQEIIHGILKDNLLEGNIFYAVYPTTFVKNGHQYWNEAEKRTGKEAVVHVNFTIGEENKINRLKAANLWYVKEEVTS